ncbi:hypothetical protein ES704_01174 [subsurface metagenome]|jgi:alcohol dehydrogenase class IV
MIVETILPKRIVSGENSLTYLKSLKGKRSCLIISGTFARVNSGVVDLVKKYLKEAGIIWHIIYSQGQEPTLEYVKKSAKEVQEFLPDTIITIGGGSTIDAAKIMEVLYEYPDINDDDLFKRFNLPSIRNKIKTFVAIPTTSGTGSEVTPYNVVLVKTDNPDVPLIKNSVVDYQTIPDVIILDPVFTVSMPAAITASTGMDALVHAIEAYISKKPKNVFSDLYALEAIKLTFEYLPKAYKDGENLIARAKMQYAATGQVEAVAQGIEMLAVGGLFLMGGSGFAGKQVSFKPWNVVREEKQIKGLQGFTWSDYLLALDLYSQKKIKTKPLITHTMKLEKINEAYTIAKRRESIKIVIHP